MIIINNYKIRIKDGHYYVTSEETSLCPYCNSVLKMRDTKRRSVISSTSEKQIFHMRRLKCTKCGSLHLELPDFVLPHKHYAREVIERAVHTSAGCCPAENSTIYRWGKELSADQPGKKPKNSRLKQQAKVTG